MDLPKSTKNNMEESKLLKSIPDQPKLAKINTDQQSAAGRKSPKRNIYQMQKAVDHSKIKPQNSWKIYKKMTILFSINTSNPCPYSRLDLVKELAPKIYEHMKENISDLTMNSIQETIPFNQKLKTADDSQEIELRYLVTENNKNGFATDSKDYVYSIDIIDSKDHIPRNYKPETSKIIVLVFLTKDQLTSQTILTERPELMPVLFIFDLASLKMSFEGLRGFIRMKVFAIQDEKIQRILNQNKLAATYESLISKPLKYTDVHVNELAMKVALLTNAKEKIKFFQDLNVRFGRPPDAIFQTFKRNLEISAMKIVKEIQFARPSPFNPSKIPTMIIFENPRSHKITKNEIKELALWQLEQFFFHSQTWKKNLYMYLGRPSSEKTWKDLRNEIDKKVIALKASFERNYQDLYYKNKSFVITKPKFHLHYLSKGFSLMKTKCLAESLADYFVRHKFWAEISKETIKIFLGNVDAGVKIERGISELKQLTLDLQANLQKMNDERTSFAYIQQDFDPLTNKNKINVPEESKSLEKLRRSLNQTQKLLLIFSENCVRSLAFVKNSSNIYQTHDSDSTIIWRVSSYGVDKKNWTDLKAKIKGCGMNRLLFLISDDSLDIMESLLQEITLENENLNKIKGVLLKFLPTKKENMNGIFENISKTLLFNYIEDTNQMSLKKLITILGEREKPIEESLRKNLVEFLDEKSNNNTMKNYQQFFDFINQSTSSSSDDLNQEIVQELFQSFFQLKAKSSEIGLNELMDSMMKGLKKLDLAIEQREIKAMELKSKKNDIIQKSQGLNDKLPDYIGLKLGEIEGMVYDQSKIKKIFFWISYANYKTNPKEIKALNIKEKFLFPLEKTFDSIEVWVKSETNALIENFIIKFKDNEANEKVNSSILNQKSTIKIKFKLVNLEKETMKINLKNLEKLHVGNNKFLENLYKFKYDFQALLKQKVISETEENFNSFDLNEFNEKMQKNLDSFQIQINQNEEKLQHLKSQQNSPNSSNPEPNSKVKSKEIEKTIEKTDNLELIRLREQRNMKMLDEITLLIESQKKQLEMMKTSNQQSSSLKQQITDFFNAAINSEVSPCDLLKLRDYFLYFQKAILKFYIKASLIEADLFEMKKDAKTALIKNGLSMLAGSVPFIGDILKSVVQTAIELKEKYDEMKLMTKCTKFCVLVNSSEILSEVLEECALILIKDKEKQSMILGLEGFKETFWDKLKKKVLAFLKKAKEKLFGKKKEEKLLKDIDTPAKLLANLDAAFVCAHAASRLEIDGNNLEKFDNEDPYCKKPLIGLFVKLAQEIGPELYEKVLDFNDDKSRIEISMEKKSVQDLDKDIDRFAIKSTENCFEEIKRNNLDDDKNSQNLQKIEVLPEIAKAEINFEEIKAKEKEIEAQIEKLLVGKASHKLILTSHEEKLMKLEESFVKIEMGSKAGTLTVKELKDHVTMVEYETIERTKALTRTAEAIPETINFLEKYKPIFVKRKALK